MHVLVDADALVRRVAYIKTTSRDTFFEAITSQVNSIVHNLKLDSSDNITIAFTAPLEEGRSTD